MSVELEERLDHLYSNLTPGRFEYMDADGAAFTVEEAADTLRRYREALERIADGTFVYGEVSFVEPKHIGYERMAKIALQVPHE